MAYLEVYYTICDGCGRRDIAGPWESKEEADKRSYLVVRDGKHYCWADCDPERCMQCNGHGEIYDENGEYPEECPDCHNEVVRQHVKEAYGLDDGR